MIDFSKILTDPVFEEIKIDGLGVFLVECVNSERLKHYLETPLNDMISDLLYDKDKEKAFTEDNKDQLENVIPLSLKKQIGNKILEANGIGINYEDTKKK